MADNNTSGAVHLTSLDLDISRIQEQISTIRTELDNLANSAQDSGNRIRDSLNFQNQQIGDQINLQNFQNQFNQATQATNNFANTFQEATQTIENAGRQLSGTNIDNLIANLRVDDSARAKLEDLFNTLERAENTISKIQITTRNGGLFRAVTTETDEYNRTIQRTIDLTSDASVEESELGRKYVDNANSRVRSANAIANAAERQRREMQQEALSAETLATRYADLRISFQALVSEMSSRNDRTPAMENLVTQAAELSRQIIAASENYERGSGSGSVRGFEQIYRSLSSTLSNLTNTWRELTSAEDEADRANNRTVQTREEMISQFERLIKRYSSFGATLSKSNVNDPGVENLRSQVKDAEQTLKDYNRSLINNRSTVEEARAIYDSFNSTLTNLGTSYNDITHDVSQANKAIGDQEDKINNMTHSVNELALKYSNFLLTLAKAKLPSEQIEPLKIDTKGTLQKIDELREGLKNNTITVREAKAQYEAYNDLLTTTKTKLADLNTASVEANSVLKDQSNTATITTAKINDLVLKYSQFVAQLTSSKITNSGMEKLTTDAKSAEEELKQMAVSLKDGSISAEQASQRYTELLNALKDGKTSFNDIKTAANEQAKAFQEVNQKISEMISSLKKMESSAKNTSQKQQISNLREEYQKLANSIKNGTISVSDAKSRLNELGNNFNNLSVHVNNGANAIQRFVQRLTDSIKWRIANAALMTITNSFRNVINTIKETEDAIIAIQRLLNDPSISKSSLKEELFDIAYTYGQSLENVREVAQTFAQTGLGFEDTIEATRVTMLALNAAEIDSKTATEGLVAVMNQFGYTASDLEEIIDKVNIASDKFPITSEKIISALQRAGSTAHSYGMTIEQTITAITALGSATGRTGEAIGTAMNSLIQFSMKAGSLEKFEDFLGLSAGTLKGQNPFNIWVALAKEIDKTGDSLAKTMAASEEFQDLFSEDLANALGLQDEFNNALAAGQDIYSTVGTYRQNYFIALLNAIQDTIKLLEEMDGISGYTAKKNEKAMDTLSKKLEQLVITAKELAIQFGEAGFLDLAKYVVEATTSVLKFTKSIGGLNTVLTLLTTLIIYIKRDRIETIFNNAIISVMNFNTKLREGATAFQLFGNSAKNAAKNIGAFLSSGAGILTVITLITGAINFLNQKSREYIESLKEEQSTAINTAKAHHDENIVLAEAINKYERTLKIYKESNDSKGKMKSVSEKLISALGYEADAVDELTDEYGKLNKKILEESHEELTKRMLEYAEAIKGATESYNTFLGELMGQSPLDELLGKKLGMSDIFEIAPQATHGIKEAAQEYDRLNDKLVEIADTMGAKNAVQDEEYKKIKKVVDALEPYVEQYRIAVEQEKQFKDTLDETNDSLDENADSSANATAYMEEWAESIEALKEQYETLNDSVDNFQKAYSSIIDIMNEYNETGIMTADMLQTLLEMEPEYINMLDIKTGSISLNEEAVNNLIGTNDNYMIQLAAIRAETYANELADRILKAATEDLTAAEIIAQMQTMALQGSVAQAAAAFLSGADDGTAFANAITEIGNRCNFTGNQLEALTGIMSNYINTMRSAFGLAGIGSTSAPTYTPRATPIRTYYTPKTSSKSSGSKKSSSASEKDPLEEQLKEEKKAMDELIDAYEHAVFLIEKNSRSIDKKATDAMKEAVDIYNAEMREVTEKGIDLSKTVFGNIDTNSRQILEWTEENLELYKDALASWGYELDEIKDSISTVMGMSSEFDGIEIAFSPILQTEDGPVLLDEHTVNEYIWGLLDEVKKKGDWTTQDILALDATGLEFNGRIIKNLLADIGETAIQTGEAMHYVGNDGSLQQAIKNLEEVKSQTRTSKQQIVQIYKEMQQELHKQADKYRALGEKESSSYIRDLSKKWWELEEEIEEIVREIYEDSVDAHENALYLLEKNYDRAANRMDYSAMTDNLSKQLNIQKKLQEEAHAEAQRLRKLGVDENDEAIQACIKTWWEAEDAIQEINEKIQSSILDTYDDFIDLADKFDIWEYMDFTKVEYLELELREINALLNTGIMSLKEYNERLKEITYALFEAQKEELEKKQDEIKDKADKVVKEYEKQKELLEKQKDDIKDYWDGIIDGYEKEIDIWEKRKDEVEKYYDSLIDNLKDVQKQNDRINKQIDYYNSRQKIITNLEQAQARSGVEWREKEVEYQQQLIELDENWRRTLEEWDIEDQIERLEYLKEMAIADFDMTIAKIREAIDAANEASDAAVDAIEKEIEGIEEVIKATEEAAEEEIAAIEEQIKDLSRTIAEAIKNGCEDGIVNSREEFDQAIRDSNTALLNFAGEMSSTIQNATLETSKNSYDAFKNGFVDPSKNIVSEMADAMRSSIVNGMQQAATDAYSKLKSSLIDPIKSEMASLASQAKETSNKISSASSTPKSTGSTTSTKKSTASTTTKTSKPTTTSSSFTMEGTGTPKLPSKKDYLLNSVKNPININIINNNRGLSEGTSKTQSAIQKILGK